MKFLSRVLIKALLLYVAFNLLAGLIAAPHLGRISAYNGLIPGRSRFPFGENPREAYNFSLFDVDAMFASHQVAQPRASYEFRVLVIGDSSVWGTLLRPEETLAGQLNRLNLTAPDGRRMKFYNLGYPTISLTKDLMILDQARQSAPDMIIWLVTLEAFPRDKQLAVPLVENNPERSRAVIERYGLDLPVQSLKQPTFWDRTLIGRRKGLADWLRLQLYGVMWAATGIDQTYPADYPRAQTDLEADPTFHGQENLTESGLTFEALANAHQALGKTPLLVVNEPILISTGKNSEIRYNFYYPRKAYEQYRTMLRDAARASGYAYLDAWDIVPPPEFTNSAIHLNQQGTARLVEAVKAQVLSLMRGE